MSENRTLVLIYLLLMVASAIGIAFRGFTMDVLVGIGVTLMGGMAIALAILLDLEEKIKR